MGLLHQLWPSAPAPEVTCGSEAPAPAASAAATPEPEAPRWAHDALRRRPRDRIHSTALASRLLGLRRDWVHVVMLLDGPDANPYNPFTVDEVREFTQALLGSAPAVLKLERSARSADGGLHVHLVLPAQILDPQRTRWEFITVDGVIVRAQRCGFYAVGDGADDLPRLLTYLHKPAHAGWSWFRASGPQTPQYLAAEAALAAGNDMCQALGHTRLRRTFWTQHLLRPSRQSAQAPGRAPEPSSDLPPRPAETPRTAPAPVPPAPMHVTRRQAVTLVPALGSAHRSGVRAPQGASQDHRCVREGRVSLALAPAPNWWLLVFRRLASQLGLP